MDMIVHDAIEGAAEAVRQWLDEASKRAVGMSIKNEWLREAMESSAVVAEDEVRDSLEESGSIEAAVGVGFNTFLDAVAERLEEHRDEDGFDPDAALTELREQLELDAGVE